MNHHARMPPALDSDEALMTRVRRHDERALQELLRKYYVRLGNFSFTVLRRRELAEEAVLNVFLSLWRRRESLVIKSSVRSYLFSAVNNQSLNLLQSQVQRGNVWLDDVAPGELTDKNSTDTEVLYRELQAEISALIAGMPRQRQLIFRMSRLEGLRYREIAKQLGVSEHTVQNHMVQAVKQLAQELPRLRATLARNSTAAPF